MKGAVVNLDFFGRFAFLTESGILPAVLQVCAKNCALRET